MPVPEPSTPRHGVIRTALRTMPWITRICAFWLLVVIVTAITADLIPLEGPATAGSRASLQLMQALGAPLTALPELTVSR